MPYRSNDIAGYYDQTLHHYKRWWKLDKQLSVHYGFWNKNTSSFEESLKQTMVEMANRAGIRKRMRILDAGCGVGGASFFLAETYEAEVEGITLSEKQWRYANEYKKNDYSLVNFSLQNFTKTQFPNDYFDLIWACESSCYAYPKSDFLQEAYRLLKPGGRIVIADYFTTKDAYKKDTHHYLKKWADTWAITELHREDSFVQLVTEYAFHLLSNDDVTSHILPSAKRMYIASLLGALPSILYNLTHKSSRFGATHYRSGYYQYRALKQDLWRYRILLIEKKM